MADGVTFTSNKDALFAKLQKLVPNIDKQMGAANLQSANEMASLARGYAPTGATGRLIGSIRVESGQNAGSYRVLAGGPATTKTVRAGSGKPFNYALGVEFGVKPHVNAGLFAGTQNPGARKQPFYWPAYRLMKRRIKSRATRAIKNAINAI